MTRILGISGSLRRDSHNTSLLRAAAEAAGPDIEFELYDGLKQIPPYDEDDDVDPRPESVARLNEAIAAADAVFFSTPEYNSSIPGQLKNAIDWVSRPVATNALRNKPVAVVGASTGGFGAVWAQAELRKVLAAVGARVLDRDGYGVFPRVPDEDNPHAVTLAERELASRCRARGHGISTSLTRATVVRLAT